ncbi:uncharacterized protein LOC126627207 [Malus sylvestris]|uniref:uncharacterized protein LOC126627207 n=1 Tax=Malus sylvestris TaxID=3752 RepID=UPI000498A516|nr:uncharacterized protein LOC126627207 [Malus sylvestris]
MAGQVNSPAVKANAGHEAVPTVETEVTAETPIHPQDQNLSITPQKVTSAFHSWEVELDILLSSTSTVAGPSATSAEPSTPAVESNVFAKLQELLSILTLQVLQCKGLNSVGECLNDLAPVAC